ncbi:MAG: membrane integrity-associated transporter subunit PqiC, partial [Proteobacteria bacterium]|nr:membrane integrity-associated transporter subunit PqiC [Pseudomonadota bacterium]
TFSVGARTFTATRVVRRTKQGATTKEARLEEITGGGSVVRASSADEVSEAVASLLGLSFDQFCRSVVLPQGAFDRFLFGLGIRRIGEVNAKLLHAQDQQVIATRTFLQAQPAASTAVPEVVEAFEQALGALSHDLAGWVLSTGQAHERNGHR